MSNWKDVILGYYQILQIAVAMAKGLTRVKKAFQKEYDVKEIRDNLRNGELHFGDKIKTIGTFSEYLPFIDPKCFLSGSAIQSSRPRTARLQAINDVYCGALFRQGQTDAFASEVLPIFYDINSKALEHCTGEMLELQCQIIQVPSQYKRIINQTAYFTYEKEEGLLIPFGLKVLNVEPYGLVDEFKINTWLIGNLNPAPHLRINKKQCCGNCGNFFSYMQIEPVDFPFKYGCANYAHERDIAKGLIDSSEKFMNLERNGKPYIVFPNIFQQFEVFYPSVNILDETQKTHSKNVLLGAIQENMEMYFKIPAVRGWGVIVPKESTLNLDFQYDQLNKITSQTFDSNDIPKWECPNYVPDPKKIAKLKTIDEAENRNRFKLKKNF